MLRQAENRVKVEGLLSEVDLKYGSYVKEGRTVETIGGHITVLVRQKLNGVDTEMEVPVYMFAPKLTRRGDPNPAYQSIETVMKDFVSIAANGGENGADRVRITSGSIKMNEYFNAQGQLVSFPRINASFVQKATGEFRPEASFSLEFMVNSIDYVCDNDGVEVEPKKLRVKAIVPQYGGKIDIIDLYAINKGVIDAISNYWENGKTYAAKGVLNFSTTTVEVHEHMDFGEDDVRLRTTSVSELIITKGTQTPLDDDAAFSQADISAAVKEHKAALEAMKEKAKMKNTPAPTSSNAGFDLGF